MIGPHVHMGLTKASKCKLSELTVVAELMTLHMICLPRSYLGKVYHHQYHHHHHHQYHQYHHHHHHHHQCDHLDSRRLISLPATPVPFSCSTRLSQEPKIWFFHRGNMPTIMIMMLHSLGLTQDLMLVRSTWFLLVMSILNKVIPLIQMAATCCVPFHQDTSGTGLPPLASHLSIWLRANNNLVLPIFQSGHSNAHTAVIFLLCLPDHNKRALRVRPNGWTVRNYCVIFQGHPEKSSK